MSCKLGAKLHQNKVSFLHANIHLMLSFLYHQKQKTQINGHQSK